MKLIYNAYAVLFCIITLGFIDVKIKYTDGSKFEWIGWISRMLKEGGEG